MTSVRKLERNSHRRDEGSEANAARARAPNLCVAGGVVFLNASVSMRSANDAGLAPSPASNASVAARFPAGFSASALAHAPMSS